MAVTPYKTKSGATTYRVRYRKPNGKNGSATFTTKKAALTFDRNRLTLGAEAAEEIADAQDTAGTSLSLEEYALGYVEGMSGVTAGTRSRYTMYATKKLGALGRLPVKAVAPEAISKWINILEREGYSHKTMSNYHGFLSGTMKHALRAGIIESNPCDGTRIPKTAKREMTFLARQEFLDFLGYIPERARSLVACMPATGMRWGEITALQVKHVNFEDSTLRVAQSWKWTDSGARLLGPPKTKKSIRTIGAPAVVMHLLAPLVEGGKADDFVFTNPNTGKPWTKSTFHTRVWQPAAKEFAAKTGKHPRVHDMRHTCASWMIGEGIPLPVIQRHLGHESIQTTVDVYGHLEPAAMLKAAGALGFDMPTFPAIEA